MKGVQREWLITRWRRYVTSIRGRDPADPEALEFTLLNVGHRPDPQWNGPSFNFTLKDVIQNRQLVWVSLIRDALAHTLPAGVGYSYEQPPDPGSGTVISIVVSSDPFRIDPQGNQYIAIKTATGHVSSLSVDQFKVAHGEEYLAGPQNSRPHLNLRARQGWSDSHGGSAAFRVGHRSTSTSEETWAVPPYRTIRARRNPAEPPESMLLNAEFLF